MTENEFIKTFVYDYIQLKTTKLADKYIEKIPKNISIKSTVNYIIENNLQDSFIDKEFHGDFNDRQNVTYLMKNDVFGYKTFFSERGFKHNVENYLTLKKALFSLIDSRFNELMHAAPDSIINGNNELPKVVQFIVNLYSKSDK